MKSVKRYRADHRHVVETEFDDAQFVGVADYDAAIMRMGNMVCAKRQMDEELEIARDDLLIFKSGLSALGEATKKLVVCARTSGGTAGPDQGLMDACAGVESVITLAGVARAMNEFERIQAENLALQQRLTVQDQRNDELSAHNQLLRKLLGQAKASLNPTKRLAKAINAALNPTAEAVSHE